MSNSKPLQSPANSPKPSSPLQNPVKPCLFTDTQSK